MLNRCALSAGNAALMTAKTAASANPIDTTGNGKLKPPAPSSR